MARKSARDQSAIAATQSVELDPPADSTLSGKIALPVTQGQIDKRLSVCREVAVNFIRNPHAPPGDDRLPRCLAEIDALARIIPTIEEPSA